MDLAIETTPNLWRSATMGAIAAAVARLPKGGASFWRLSVLLGPGAVPLLLIILSLPHMLPIVIPGTGIASAVPMVCLAAGLLRGRQRLELPAWVGRRRLEFWYCDKLLSALDRLLGWVERFSPPRFDHLLGKGMRVGIAGAILLMVILIVLPLPAGNPPAAAAVVAFAVGLLRRDGLLILVGHAIGVIAVAWNVAIAALIYIAGVEIWSIL